ncbi:MAG TPA: twin-arginine translocase TatA/TatE family subunit [Gemmatimonadaceae bacterium]|nr:twin-arginine translocase TatA/TatE family subunit [Gemmatimonadaceae bacterium]
MGFEGFGIEKILLVLLIVLLLFGAKRIPEIAGSMGKGIREFKKSMKDTQAAVAQEISPRDDHERLRPPDPAPVAEDARPEPKRLLDS